METHMWMKVGEKMMTNHFPGSSMDAKVYMNYLRQSSPPIETVEPTLEEIFTDVAMALGVDPVVIKRGRSYKELAYAKKIFCYVASECTTRNQTEIGDVVKIGRSVVSINKDKVKAYLRGPGYLPFIPFWDQYTENSTLYQKLFNDKGVKK